MTDTQKVLAALGGVVLVIGLCFGLMPGTAGYGPGTISCGSPWVRDYSAAQSAALDATLDDAQHGLGGVVDEDAEYRSMCDDALGVRAISGVLVSTLGAVMVLSVAVLVTAARGRRRVDGPPAAG